MISFGSIEISTILRCSHCANLVIGIDCEKIPICNPALEMVKVYAKVFVFVFVCVCSFVCMCERERERESEIESEIERERREARE